MTKKEKTGKRKDVVKNGEDITKRRDEKKICRI